MNDTDKGNLIAGMSFSAKLILAMLIGAPLHVMYGIDEIYAITIGLICAFQPRLVYRAILGAFGLSTKVVKGTFGLAFSLIKSIANAIGKIFSKSKKHNK